MTFEENNKTNKTLIISLPRGLYRLTKCLICKHVFQCDNCDNNLTTIKQNNKLILLCSECQSSYNYPSQCPKCSSKEINSLFGGRDYLEEVLVQNELQVDVSNRIFNSTLNYKQYNKIILTHTENLFLGIDYQSIEENAKSLSELLLNLEENTKVVFDQAVSNQILDGINNPLKWYQEIIEQESINRKKFSFPPEVNLLLISSSEKNKSNAISKLNIVRSEILELKSILKDVGTPSYPYEAKMLKRKGMYTMHMYIKYPKNYSEVSTLNRKLNELKSRYRIVIRLNPRHIF
ncbi:MAG: hypothetical protein ACRCXZ_05595 [Patescibacteria group bacterium]